jgi:hypothetical protein
MPKGHSPKVAERLESILALVSDRCYPVKVGEAQRIESCTEVKREAPRTTPRDKSQTKFRKLSNSYIIGL